MLDVISVMDEVFKTFKMGTDAEKYLMKEIMNSILRTFASKVSERKQNANTSNNPENNSPPENIVYDKPTTTNGFQKNIQPETEKPNYER